MYVLLQIRAKTDATLQPNSCHDITILELPSLLPILHRFLSSDRPVAGDALRLL
jgi:hypothetical protein